MLEEVLGIQLSPSPSNINILDPKETKEPRRYDVDDFPKGQASQTQNHPIPAPLALFNK